MTRNLKFSLLFVLISSAFNSHAAFVSQPDTMEMGNFLLLTPLEKTFSDRTGLRTKEHLTINENDRVKYRLKDSERTKRGKIIRITDNEVQIYNQVTGKLEHVPIDDFKTISRVNTWKSWAGYLSLYWGLSLLLSSLVLGVFGIIFLLIDGIGNGIDEELIMLGIYGTLSLLIGMGATYAAANVLYKYKKFRIGRKYKIGIYSMKKLNK